MCLPVRPAFFTIGTARRITPPATSNRSKGLQSAACRNPTIISRAKLGVLATNVVRVGVVW